MRRAILIFVVLTLTARAEQKNVKLLTGLTDIELQRTMNMMRASMGTHCDFCHVSGEKWDFASDEKPQKKKAREMIQMVMDLNASHFGGRSVISCYSCHRGATRPVNTVPLPTPAPPFPTPVPEKVELPALDTLIARYAAALGDVTRLNTRHLIGEATKAGNTAPIEIREQNGKLRQITRLQKGPLEQSFDGTNYWWRDTSGTGIMPPAGQENFSALAGAFAPVLPTDVGTESHVIRKEKVGERDTWVVQRGGPKEPYRRFFFDTETGLLLRSMLYVPRSIGTIPQQTDYEDYRDVGGTKVPFLVRVSMVDPWTGVTRQYKTVELGTPVDDAEFAMPK
jgi:Photosynthetic reaction centre cytochrome C subunit